MSLANHIIPFKTILTKEVRRFMRIWIQTLLPPAITISLYFVIFGTVIGSRIGTMAGFDYMQFIVPGLIMMAVINNSYSNVVSSFFSTKYQHSIEELLVAPVPPYIIVAGFVLGGVTRGLMIGCIGIFISLLFADLSVKFVGVTVAIIFMSSILFALMGFINAVYANSFDDISIIPTFVLTPLIYLGGVFYAIELLPDFWHKVSMFNPIVYMIGTFRYGMLGLEGVDVGLSFFIVGLFITLLFSFCVFLLRTGIGIKK